MIFNEQAFSKFKIHNIQLNIAEAVHKEVASSSSNGTAHSSNGNNRG
jgi:hypothetical protein